MLCKITDTMLKCIDLLMHSQNAHTDVFMGKGGGCKRFYLVFRFRSLKSVHFRNTYKSTPYSFISVRKSVV